MDFGQKLKRLRKLCRPPLTQEKLSEALNVSPQLISAWEKGRRKINWNDRQLLLSLIQTLYKHQGIETLEEANSFLKSGGYLPLTDDEKLECVPAKLTPEKSKLAQPETSTKYPVIFTNIWYDTKKYSLHTLYRNYDIGTLFIYTEKVIYKGAREDVEFKYIQAVNHIRQKGSISPNWVELIFGIEKPLTTAYLAEGRKLGIGELVGGSEELFSVLYRLFGE